MSYDTATGSIPPELLELLELLAALELLEHCIDELEEVIGDGIPCARGPYGLMCQFCAPRMERADLLEGAATFLGIALAFALS